MEEPSQLALYHAQSTPKAIVVIAIGLAGTEDSVYVADLIAQLPKCVMIVAVRGLETSSHTSHEKFFVKHDCSRITRTMHWLHDMYPDTPKLGVGISLGGALLLRHQAIASTKMRPVATAAATFSSFEEKAAGVATPVSFDALVIASTSLCYEHAINTMSDTFKGRIANKLITWWQFKCLFFGKNYLTTVKRPSIWQWTRLFFASNLLVQDRVLCELYGFEYETYIQGLDLRFTARMLENVHYLVSRRDPMFSAAHQTLTEEVLAGSRFQSEWTTFGGHGEFTSNPDAPRNDYLVATCLQAIVQIQDHNVLATV